jgi:hypothetical protein
MKTQQEVEKLRDEVYAKALEYQSKSSDAYFNDDKLAMNEYNQAYGKFLAQYQILLKVLE